MLNCLDKNALASNKPRMLLDVHAAASRHAPVMEFAELLLEPDYSFTPVVIIIGMGDAVRSRE